MESRLRCHGTLLCVFLSSSLFFLSLSAFSTFPAFSTFSAFSAFSAFPALSAFSAFSPSLSIISSLCLQPRWSPRSESRAARSLTLLHVFPLLTCLLACLSPASLLP